MIEPKIGEIFSLHGMMVKTCSMKDNEHCKDCAFAHLECTDIICYSISREDSTRVIFKEVEQTKIKPMEVKIEIPNNCELIKNGDTYIVREKKQGPPRSWEEFCERYPVSKDECRIGGSGMIGMADSFVVGQIRHYKTWINSKEEAEAFLALMQLRQLRKAWVGDWEPSFRKKCNIVYHSLVWDTIKIKEKSENTDHISALSFPTKEMATDFAICFEDLCETAKILL